MKKVSSPVPVMKRRYAGGSYPAAKRFAGLRLAGAAIRRGATMATRAWRRAGGRGSISKRIRGAPQRWRKRLGRFSRRRRTGRAPVIPYVPNPGNELTVSNRRFRLKRYSLKRVVATNRNRLVLRYQGLSNFDTSTGFHSIGNWVNTTTDQVSVPLHMYDLTVVPNNSTTCPAARVFGIGTASASNGTPYFAALNGQMGDGTLDSNWQFERGNVQPYRTDSFLHDWTSVKLNLYGARKRTTYFDVMFVRFPNEFASLGSASTSNADFKNLLAYLTRPLMYSNINVYNPEVASNIKVVKRFRYYVPPTQSIDLNTTTGKIKNVNIFIRHNTRYKLDYNEAANVPAMRGADLVDYTNQPDDQNHNYPKHERRLYMIIRAFAPEQRSTAGWPVVDAAIDPSYDILLRNGITMNRGPATG